MWLCMCIRPCGRQEGHCASSSITFSYFLETRSLIELEACHVAFCMVLGTELKYLRLHSNCFIHWAISPANFLFFSIYFSFYACVCFCVCCVYGDKQRSEYSIRFPRTGVGVVVSGPTWVLRTAPKSSMRAGSALKQLSSLPARMFYLRQRLVVCLGYSKTPGLKYLSIPCPHSCTI